MEVPYCGPAPGPDTLMSSWNFDPVALGVCAALVALHVSMRGDGRVTLGAALAVLLVLFVSPLCALTTALFSARALHHVALVALAAPLLAAAFPLRAHARRRLPLSALAGLHAVALWFWHWPPAYAVAIWEAPAYWAMQASLAGTAFAMWRRVLSPREPAGATLGALLFTIVQMGMLGALLTFAGRPLYQAHLLTTEPFGLSPLDDQQLAGLLMWVPAALPYLGAALWRLARLIAPPDATSAAARS